MFWSASIQFQIMSIFLLQKKPAAQKPTQGDHCPSLNDGIPPKISYTIYFRSSNHAQAQ